MNDECRIMNGVLASDGIVDLIERLLGAVFHGDTQNGWTWRDFRCMIGLESGTGQVLAEHTVGDAPKAAESLIAASRIGTQAILGSTH